MSGSNSVKSQRFLPSNLVAALIVVAGFLLRLKLAADLFLNEDEALHFMAANQPSWKLTYQASLTISHPPLLIFVLHLWRTLGTSEVILRLPCVIAGTAFCWVFFKWLTDLFGTETAFVGLIFASFLPPMIALSAEVRQYSFLLFFAICAMYLLERALAENSARKMLFSSVCLWLALFSQYSAVLLAATLGIYALLRISRNRPRGDVIVIWLAGQIGGLLICLFLYFKYVSVFGHQALHSWMDIYLHNSYFDPARHHVLLFAFSRTASLFQYVLGQNVVGDAMFILWALGIVWVFTTKSSFTSVPSAQLGTMLILPFAINCAAALVDVYPYGGTRHCVFLEIFAIAGISFALSRLTSRSVWRGIAVAAVIVGLSNIFPSHRLPYMPRADQEKAHMQQAVAFIYEHVPPSSLLFVDSQTSLLLGHYLCAQHGFFVDVWKQGFQTINCGGYRIAAADGYVFSFTAANFFPTWNEMESTYKVKPGDTVWVMQAGWLWEKPVAEELKERYTEFGDLEIHSFGHNITMFPLKVDGAMQAGAGNRT